MAFGGSVAPASVGKLFLHDGAEGGSSVWAQEETLPVASPALVASAKRPVGDHRRLPRRWPPFRRGCPSPEHVLRSTLLFSIVPSSLSIAQSAHMCRTSQ
jgi:hypothetical protein